MPKRRTMRKVKSKLSKISEQARRPRKKRGKKTARKKSKRGKSWNKRVATTYKSMKDSNPDTTLGDAIKKASTGHRLMSGGSNPRRSGRARTPALNDGERCPGLGMSVGAEKKERASQADQGGQGRRVITKTRRAADAVGRGAAGAAARAAADAEKAKNWITTSRDLLRLVGEQKMRRWMNAMLGSGPLVSDEENTARAAAAAIDGARAQASRYSAQAINLGVNDLCDSSLALLPDEDIPSSDDEPDETSPCLKRSPSTESPFNP